MSTQKICNLFLGIWDIAIKIVGIAVTVLISVLISLVGVACAVLAILFATGVGEPKDGKEMLAYTILLLISSGVLLTHIRPRDWKGFVNKM
jgi:hypothetical protein